MNRAQPGFTLLEVLVALVVLGFLMVGLTQGLRLGLGAWGRQSTMIARREDLDAVDRTLRGLIEQLNPGTPTDPPLIAGEPGRIAFTSRLPFALGAESADIAIGLDAQHRLVMHWTPHLHGRRVGAAPPPQTAVLIDRLARIEFAYWRPAGGWVRTWTESRLPALIRIRLIFPPGDSRHWPDLVAAPLRMKASNG